MDYHTNEVGFGGECTQLVRVSGASRGIDGPSNSSGSSGALDENEANEGYLLNMSNINQLKFV